jgi:hypothetical protein
VTWWASLSGVIVIGWVLTARMLLAHGRTISELRERVTWLEAKVNGQAGGSHAKAT